jgi:hypothetical protein
MKTAMNIKKWGAACLFGIMTAVFATAPATAHHSFAMYDMENPKTFTGKMTRFVPGANHAQLFFNVIDENGEVVMGEDGEPLEWGAETGPSARIAQIGITVDKFTKGSVVKMTINPLKDGRNFGFLARGEPIIHCGDEMPANGCTKETGEVFRTSDPDDR